MNRSIASYVQRHIDGAMKMNELKMNEEYRLKSEKKFNLGNLHCLPKRLKSTAFEIFLEQSV